MKMNYVRVKEKRNTLCTVKRRKANVVGHVLHKNFLLKRVIEEKIEGKIEVNGTRERRLKQLLDDIMEMTGYWKLKAEALRHSM
jgi:hypothetical protein